jgi:RNA polymerase sigma-70 factor (ECF subfamily)
MDDTEFLAGQFEAHRAHLRAVSYRMLGSLSEADDAVQEAWVRLSRSDAEEIENLGGWLTTVVARVCLNVLRRRRTRSEEPLDELRLPDPIVEPIDGGNPEHEALLADSVGLALLVVLEQLSPAERLAFVLHDMFAVPFDEIAPMVERTPEATRQLASRARRRVQGAAPEAPADRARQREVAEAFKAAAREGDFERLVSVLHPDVVLRADTGPGSPLHVRVGAETVASQAILFRSTAPESDTTETVLVNGAPGLMQIRDGRPFSVVAFTISGDRIVQMDIIADPGRLARLPIDIHRLNR